MCQKGLSETWLLKITGLWCEYFIEGWQLRLRPSSPQTSAALFSGVLRKTGEKELKNQIGHPLKPLSGVWCKLHHRNSFWNFTSWAQNLTEVWQSIFMHSLHLHAKTRMHFLKNSERSHILVNSRVLNTMRAFSKGCIYHPEFYSSILSRQFKKNHKNFIRWFLCNRPFEMHSVFCNKHCTGNLKRPPQRLFPTMKECFPNRKCHKSFRDCYQAQHVHVFLSCCGLVSHYWHITCISNYG